MTTLIITIVILGWIASALVRTADKRSRERHYAAARNRERSFDYRLREAEIETKRLLAESKAETERIIALEKARIEQEKWNAKQEEINRKQAEEVLKLNKRVSTLEMKVEQAEYDIEIEKENLDRFSAKLSQLDEDLKHAEWEIDSWAKQRHLANVAKAEAKRDKIKDSIYAWEDKVRKAEKRLAKAERTKTIAENELREVA